MDPYAPIHGISLERYAELGAELDGVTDPQAQAAKVAEHGIDAASWEAAKTGWTARMQDMSLMGQVATRYMQLFNEAVANKKGVAKCSFDDWIAVSAAIQVFGPQAALAQYDLSQGDWTAISSHWQTELMKDPMNMGQRRNQLQEQEANRLRQGGGPRPIQVERSAAGSPAAGGGSQGAFAQGADGPAQMAAAQAQGQAAMAYAASVLNQPHLQAAMKVAHAMSPTGGGAFSPGGKVMVQWSDGNQYPGTIMQTQGTQSMVVFPNGQQMWVEQQYLTPA